MVQNGPFGPGDSCEEHERPPEAPASEVSYAPPMEIPTRNTDTGSLAAIIGPQAAAAARHAPLPEHTVMIDEESPEEGALEWPVESGVDSVDDAASTLRMPAPAADDEAELAHASREVAAQSNPPPRGRGPRKRAVFGFVASLLLGIVAVLMWTRRGGDSASFRERAPMPLVPVESPPPATSVAVVAPPEEPRIRIPSEIPLAVDPMTLPPDTKRVPSSIESTASSDPDVSRSAARIAVAAPASSVRRQERMAVRPNGNDPNCKKTSENAKNPNAPIDPLFTDDPGY
jgi:hypothetical protein